MSRWRFRLKITSLQFGISNTQPALIRFALARFSKERNVRREFLKQRTEQIHAAWHHLAKTEAEQFLGWEDFLAPTFAKKESQWLRSNLQAVIEFSEHRLNQMELIVRYALFEAALKDVVGNVLWEYPEIIDTPVHKSFDLPKKRRPGEDDEDFRGRVTEKLVDSIGKLRYKPYPQTKSKFPACLGEYLKVGLGLEFGEQKFIEVLEKTRNARNKIGHRSNLSPTVLTEEFMASARAALYEFPRRLIRAAIEDYPDACTEEASEFEFPGYLVRKLLRDL